MSEAAPSRPPTSDTLTEALAQARETAAVYRAQLAQTAPPSSSPPSSKRSTVPRKNDLRRPHGCAFAKSALTLGKQTGAVS